MQYSSSLRFLSFPAIATIVFVISGCSSSQKTTKTDTQTLERLRSHVGFLADDKLEGRRTGTKGEELAVEYITQQFKSIGLEPKGTEYYTQSFMVNEGKQIDSFSSLSINSTALAVGKDFFPFPFSPDMALDAIPAIAVQEADMPWFFDLKEPLEENKTNPHFDLAGYIYKNAQKAKERGAAAIFLYNTSGIEDKLVFNPKDRSEKLTIPVIYISRSVAEKYFSDKTATLTLKMRIGISEKTRIGILLTGHRGQLASLGME